jgi:hypothetical protein
MTEMVLLIPVALLLFRGIDYFRSGYALRLNALGRSQTAAWKAAVSNDGSCFANKEPWAGFFGDNDPSSVSMDNHGSPGDAFKSNTTSSLFLYAHANFQSTLSTKEARWDGGSTGAVKGGTYVLCNEVVPVTDNSNNQYADQDVLTPLWDFVAALF